MEDPYYLPAARPAAFYEPGPPITQNGRLVLRSYAQRAERAGALTSDHEVVARGAGAGGKLSPRCTGPEAGS